MHNITYDINFVQRASKWNEKWDTEKPDISHSDFPIVMNSDVLPKIRIPHSIPFIYRHCIQVITYIIMNWR